MNTTMNTTPSIADQPQRDQALNPRHSFIVQAPAGSGKTELLTQRFLVLLSHVKQPEEILAITFTKKSAAEMRDRIINALQKAATEPEPSSAYAKKTWLLAHQVLQRDQALSWHILKNPNQLRIQTIDSFNASLTKLLPILSNFGAPPDITEDAILLYREAVQEFLSHLEENVAWSDTIAQLLLHLDNDLNKVQTLLINMLAKRDQWLPYISLDTQNPLLRKKLEENLASITIDHLIHLQDLFSTVDYEELLSLADFAAKNLKQTSSPSLITHCADIIDLPGTEAEDKLIWLGLTELLLTAQGEWRSRLDKSIGFPAPSSTKQANEKLLFTEYKQRMSYLLEQFSEHPELKFALFSLKLTPRCQYETSQWHILSALHEALRIAAAQLKVSFQQHSKIDYIENAQAALIALGTEDNPTDITLALDYQIKHILIDEFQDTSNSQYKLLEKLIAGWEPHDGRTLFVVGDPMQSIYRFREAEVGFFIRARQNGIGRIPLKPLTLNVNFRSISGIVEWVNQHFKTVFPVFEDINLGAVSYNPSSAFHTENCADSAVNLHSFINSPSAIQAKTIVKLIQEIKKTNPTETIAILVRSRTHLANIIPALKQAGLLYRAINIDPLDTRQIIQDMMALTRALVYPADRIAWLALLRAPWCGLSLSDLLILTDHTREITLWEQLNNDALISKLSETGKQQLHRILPILKIKMAERNRYTLRLWVESTWLSLGGPACVSQLSDIEDVKVYLSLLEKLEESNILFHPDKLNEYVSKLYASSNLDADDTLQIMTIHNAKGLEFDTVILPHLECKSPPDEKQLMLWMERTQADGKKALILAPVHATGEKTDSIYEYIKKQHGEKIDYENARLLYVAATRAKKKLHILFNLQENSNSDNTFNTFLKPSSSSLLAKLWPAIQSTVKAHSSSSTIFSIDKDPLLLNPHFINRLSLEWNNPIVEHEPSTSVAYHQKNPGFFLADQQPRLMGILIHRILQQIGLHGTDWWQSKKLIQHQAYLSRHLTQLGMLSIHHPPAIELIIKAIHNTLSDPRGKWILHPHTESTTEYPITALIDGQIFSSIIDRTFIDEQGIRWIIDYKTTYFSPDDFNHFLEKEYKKYELQMHRYYQAIHAIEKRPIKLGLYFPSLIGWYEWEGSQF